VTKEELQSPVVAWPTLFLCLLSLVIYVSPWFLTFHSPGWKAVPFSALSVFIIFTPLHEAAHRY